MSVYVMALVWRTQLGDSNLKHVALALADYADDDGAKVYPALDTVAAKTELSRDTVRRKVRELRDRELLIEVAAATSKRPAEYLLPIPRWQGLHAATPGGTVPPQGLHGATPSTSQPPTGDSAKAEPPRAGAATDAHAQGLPATVGRRAVTPGEARLAALALGYFNEHAGSRYTLAAHGANIVRRIREHPELDAAAHRAIVAVQFRSPWWKDRPAPAVIYGNAAVFERSMERWRSGGGGRAQQPGFEMDGSGLLDRAVRNLKLDGEG